MISYNFAGLDSDSLDMYFYDETAEKKVFTIRYDGNYNDPAALLFGIPESNWFHIMSQAQLDARFDIFANEIYTANAPTITLNSGTTTLHNEFATLGFTSSKLMTFLASPGDGADGTAANANGVGYYFNAGDAGSLSSADGGGFRYRLGNNNGNSGSVWGNFTIYDPNFGTLLDFGQGASYIYAPNDGTTFGSLHIGEQNNTLDFVSYDDTSDDFYVMRKNIRDAGWKNPYSVNVETTTLSIPYSVSNYIQLVADGSTTIESISTDGFYFGAEIILDANGDDWTLDGQGGNITLISGEISEALNSGSFAKCMYDGVAGWFCKLGV